ncbi:MAG: hypothetical protein FJW24_05425 [Acidimicrobiia bacterium]|nr:hypothetical protein [Acidimicrobiia bacterium]
MVVGRRRPAQAGRDVFRSARRGGGPLRAVRHRPLSGRQADPARFGRGRRDGRDQARRPSVGPWALAFHVFAVETTWATVAVVMAALPAGANCFVVAQRYGVYVQRASSGILLSTALSVVTVSLLFSLWIAN